MAYSRTDSLVDADLRVGYDAQGRVAAILNNDGSDAGFVQRATDAKGNVTGLVGSDGGIVISNARIAKVAGSLGGSNVVSQSNAVCYSQLSNGTDLSTTYRQPHVFPKGAYDIRLVYANLVTTSTTQNGTGLGSVTVTSALEYNSTFVGVTFNGQLSVVIPPNSWVVSDPIPMDIPAGGTAYIRSCPTVSSGQKWNKNHYGKTTDTYSAINTDLTLATGALANAGAGIHYESTVFSPVVVLGSCKDTTTGAVLVLGDSIAQGTCDGTPLRNVFQRGFMARGIGFDSIFTTQAIASAKLVDRILQSNQPMFNNLYSNHDYVISNFGTNDLASGTTSATLEGYVISIAKLFFNRGIKFYQTTILPKVTTSDFMATVANQTLTSVGENTRRIEFNTWIRQGCPVDASLVPTTLASAVYLAGNINHPISGYVEVANTVEVNASNVPTQDGGYWYTNGVSDSGTATGYNNMVLTDTGKSWSVNQHQGKIVLLAGNCSINIVSNTATTLTVGASPASGSVPANASTPTYSIIDTLNSGDGIHPSMGGHIAMAVPVSAWYAANIHGL